MTKLDRAPPLHKPSNYSAEFGEFIGIGPNGNLWVDGCDVKDLADRFGTPLFIISEKINLPRLDIPNDQRTNTTTVEKHF